MRKRGGKLRNVKRRPRGKADRAQLARQRKAFAEELETLGQIVTDWPAYAGIPVAIRRLGRRLPEGHVAEIERAWTLALDLLRLVRPGESPKERLQALWRSYPGSRTGRRGASGAVPATDLDLGAQRAAAQLRLPPVRVWNPKRREVVATESAAVVIVRFIEALGQILPDMTPKQRLACAADKFPATAGPPAQDGTWPIGVMPRPEAIARYRALYRIRHPRAAKQHPDRELERLLGPEGPRRRSTIEHRR